MYSGGGYLTSCSSDDDDSDKAVSVSLNKTTLSLAVGGEETLTATVSNASDTSVTWSTSDSTVATVADGTVTAVKKGTATITATSKEDSTKTATCTVTVTDESGIPSPSGGGTPVAVTYDFKTVTEAEAKALGATGLTDGTTALKNGTLLDGAVSVVSDEKFKFKTDSKKSIVTGIIMGTNCFSGSDASAVQGTINEGLNVGDTLAIGKYLEYTIGATGTYNLVLSYAMNAASGGASNAKYYIVVEDAAGKILAQKLYATGDYAAATDLSETFSNLSLEKNQKIRVTFLRGAAKGGLIVNSLAINPAN